MIAELRKKEIIEYCEKFSNQDSKILKELIKYTFDNSLAPQMISGVQVGNLLQSIIMLSNTKKILEIGMFTGYSALKMAEALPDDGEIHTCEIGENHIKTAQKFFNKSAHGNKIIIHEGPALNSLQKFNENSFDLAINNLSLHHFNWDNAIAIIKAIYKSARLGFLINDLHRSRIAHAAIFLLTRIFTRNRLTRYDAPVSVMNAFTPSEFSALAVEADIESFEIHRHFPYRIAFLGKKKNG